jgi:hypothetical protein
MCRRRWTEKSLGQALGQVLPYAIKRLRPLHIPGVLPVNVHLRLLGSVGSGSCYHQPGGRSSVFHTG